MPPPDKRQGELDFSAAQKEQGFVNWLEQRRRALQQLARQMGLPLGHPVEVWLHGNVRLRGVLRLHEEQLFLENTRSAHLPLEVDKVVFTPAEIESCVRLD